MAEGFRARRAICREQLQRAPLVGSNVQGMQSGYRDLRRQKRESFWTEKVRNEKSCPSELWRSVNDLMGRGSTPASSTIDAADFHRLIDDKVAGVRASTDGHRHHSTQLHRQTARCTTSLS